MVHPSIVPKLLGSLRVGKMESATRTFILLIFVTDIPMHPPGYETRQQLEMAPKVYSLSIIFIQYFRNSVKKSEFYSRGFGVIMTLER